MRLIARQYRVLRVKRGDVLVVDAGEVCSEAQASMIREHFERLGIPVAVIGGSIKIVGVRHDARAAEELANGTRPV